MDAVVFAALLMTCGAALMDLVCAGVDNMWLVLWTCAGTALRIYSHGPPEIPSVITGLAVPFILLFPFFCFRMIGAGDIKTLMALGSLVGGEAVLRCTADTFLIAAAYAVFIFLTEGGSARRFTCLLEYTKRFLITGRREPYIREKAGPWHIHLAVPVFLAAVLQFMF